MAEGGVSRLPPKERKEFAYSLYAYLYSQYGIQTPFENDRVSVHFKEVIGRAVLAFELKTHDFNRQTLVNGGFNQYYILDLCNIICTLNRPDNFFKKLFYISAFILDVVLWWREDPTVPFHSRGPNLWITVFELHFESEFLSNGGWRRMETAAEIFLQMIQNEVLMRDQLLPRYFFIVTRAFNTLFNVYQEESDLGDLLSDFQEIALEEEDESSEDGVWVQAVQQLRPVEERSAEDIQQLQPMEERAAEDIQQPQQMEERAAEDIQQPQPVEERSAEDILQPQQVEERSAEDIQQPQPMAETSAETIQQPEPMDETSVQPSPQIHGPSRDVVQDPCEGTSQSYGEVAPKSQDTRSRRKRRFEAPPERIDSVPEDESTSATKAKVDRK